MELFANVLIFKNIVSLDKPFTYRINKELVQGSFVIVDFNNRLEVGLVLNTFKDSKNEKIKDVLKVVEELKPLDDIYIKLGLWMKKFYVLTYAKAFGTVCDFSLIDDVKYVYKNNTEEDKINDLVDRVNSSGVSEKDKDILDQLLKDKSISLDVAYRIIEPEDQSYFKANMSIKEALKAIRSNATRQLGLVLEIYDIFEDKTVFSLEDLYTLKNYNKQVFDQLVERKIFIPSEYIPEDLSQSVVLNDKQKSIVNNITNRDDNKFLIHGVTGSGKTEVYFSLIEEEIAKGNGVIFLVPEIGLTPQMEKRIIDRFGKEVAIIHSGITKKKRATELNRIKNKEAKILLGTRSAIFVDVPDLSLIIIDEEHDSSYKLDEYNKYDVREVSRFLIESLPGAKMVLGSATPSVESYFKGKHNVYKLLELDTRYKDISMPNVIITDMKEDIKQGNNTPFSMDLMVEMKKTLSRDKQVLLFLNRRGFAPVVSCRDCGTPIECDRCDISMVYHKGRNLLQCHYCGQLKRLPNQCPSCTSPNIKMLGLGTEQLEQLTKELFPDFEVLRIDSNTTNKLSDYESNMEKIESGDVDIIIGTQMISKGFDYPDIELVGIIAADLSLHMPDYRATEDTFQMLVQVAGRAGRKSKGTVVVQTYNPDNYSIESIKDHDYKSFYNNEIKMRHLFSYPPFVRQYILTITGNDFTETLNKAKQVQVGLQQLLKKHNINKSLEFLSHEDRLVGIRINNRYRVKVMFNSSIKDERIVKELLYKLIFEDVLKINFRTYHIDLVTR